MMKNSPSMGSGELTLPTTPVLPTMGRFLRKTKLNELPQLWEHRGRGHQPDRPPPADPALLRLLPPRGQSLDRPIRPGLSGVGSILFRDEESLLAEVPDPVAFRRPSHHPYKGQVEHCLQNQSVALYFELIITTVLVVILPSSGLHLRLLRLVPATLLRSPSCLNHKTEPLLEHIEPTRADKSPSSTKTSPTTNPPSARCCPRPAAS